MNMRNSVVLARSVIDAAYPLFFNALLTPGTSGSIVFPGFSAIRTLTCAALRFGRCFPLIITSRFAHALRSLVSERKRRVAAHNRVVLGSENPPSRSTVNQALGGAVATGVLGNPAIALCAVPLLIPVSALICAQERP